MKCHLLPPVPIARRELVKTQLHAGRVTDRKKGGRCGAPIDMSQIRTIHQPIGRRHDDLVLFQMSVIQCLLHLRSCDLPILKHQACLHPFCGCSFLNSVDPAVVVTAVPLISAVTVAETAAAVVIVVPFSSIVTTAPIGMDVVVPCMWKP